MLVTEENSEIARKRTDKESDNHTGWKQIQVSQTIMLKKMIIRQIIIANIYSCLT